MTGNSRSSGAVHIPSRIALCCLHYFARRGTIALASIVWTISPPWFVVTLRKRRMP
jgi:hypothetical protein